MKVAVIHDWLTGMRGGEMVLESILKLYPNADLFTLIYNKGKLSPIIEDRKITTAFTDRIPGKAGKYRWFLPLFPTAIETFDLRGYDLILSSSHCVAKGVIAPPGSFHLSYVHSPMRYVWDMYYEYFPKRRGLSFLFYQTISNYLRMWDTASAARVDHFTCNSDFVGQRIRKFYRREYEVVHPPCLPQGFQVQSREKEDFYLIVSAFAPYKRIDIAIEAFRQNGKKLILIGGGQDEGKLLHNLPPNVTHLSGIPREEVLDYYARARGFLFPGLEDFGITPVEAQGHCTPVIAFGKGGALETVVDGKTGVFFPDQTPESLNQAIEKSERLGFKKADFQKSVNRFTEEKFINQIQRAVDRHK